MDSYGSKNQELEEATEEIENLGEQRNSEESNDKIEDSEAENNEDDIDIDSEQVKEELDLEKIEAYKKQIEKDNEDYNAEYDSYNKWRECLYNMGLSFVKTSKKINEIIKELKVNIDSEIDNLTKEQKSDVENRVKGINIIGKMFNNTVEKNIEKTKIDATLEKQELNTLEDVDINSEDIITEKLNENYNHVSQMKNNKQSIIKDYFNFISAYILPINDGILSGIQYIHLVEKEEINRLVLPTYIKVKEKLEELLEGLGIKEIKIQEFDPLDYEKIEIFDIEETDDENRNETIHETIRNGYTYNEDLYGTGANHVVRTAQVTVYKYVEDVKAVDQDEV